MGRTRKQVLSQKVKTNKKGDKEMAKGPREGKGRGDPIRAMDQRDRSK